jgi:hypothetical protein
VNDSELDELLAAAAPIHDADVARLPLSGSDELCEAIVSTPVIESIGSPDPTGGSDSSSTDSSDPIESGGSPRKWRRWWRSRPGLAVAGAAVAVSVTAVAVVQPFGSDGGGSAWAAEALRVAESVPRLLMTADGWEVSRADEFGVASGEMTFRGPDGTEIELRWNAEAPGDDYEDFLVGMEGGGYERLQDVEIRGRQAALFEQNIVPDAPGNEAAVHDHEVAAGWRDSGYVVELRGYVSTDRFLALAASIEAVDVDTWLSALPESVVKADDLPGTVQQMLADIPLPEGFDASSLEEADVSAQDRYQLGAQVTRKVTCAWLAQWGDALAAGDDAKLEEAVAAMGTSHDWDVLREMDAEGDYPESVWEVADAMAAGTTMELVPADLPPEEEAANVLGCVNP